ncbi:MAG: (2Fe-2S)-binding protein [Halobacteriovorax sp.]|nr:(2Fe-2S)-binding protein [Halobacteriovorax sp.]
MYVCICNNITEDQVKNVVAKGLTGKDALSHLGVGSGCGICVMDAIDRLSHDQNATAPNLTQALPSNK